MEVEVFFVDLADIDVYGKFRPDDDILQWLERENINDDTTINLKSDGITLILNYRKLKQSLTRG